MKVTKEDVLELAQRGDNGDIGGVFDEVTGLMNNEPDNEWLKFLFAKMSFKAQHFGVAKTMIESAVRKQPKNGTFHLNHALILDNLDDFSGALEAYDKASLDPRVDRGDLWANKAATYLKMGHIERGLRYADKALEQNPRHEGARGSRAFARFQLGPDTGPAWDDYSALLGGQFRKVNDYGVGVWNGEPGHRLIVQGEQGLGDELMYASCLMDLIAKGDCEDIALDVDMRTVRLLRNSFPGIKCYGSRAANDRPWVAKFRPTRSTLIGELPRFYRRKVGDYPGTPYIKPPVEMVAMYRQLIKHNQPAHQVVGLGWSGGGRGTKEKDREIPLEAFRPLIESRPGTIFVSLQYREGTDAEIAASGLPIKHYHWATGKGANYEHTASFIKACDFVVSTDTTAIHSAGASGVRTHCLLSTPSMWVHPPWAKDRAVWYESVKLHRKPKGQDWADYITTIKGELK